MTARDMVALRTETAVERIQCARPLELIRHQKLIIGILYICSIPVPDPSNQIAYDMRLLRYYGDKRLLVS